MIGEGEAVYRGERLSGAEAMKRAGIPAVQLAAKEGLALINGTQVMTSAGASCAVWGDEAYEDRGYSLRNDYGGAAWHNQGVR